MIDKAQLESLSNCEKLRLVATLWDQIARSKEPIQIPPTFLNDADRRLDEMLQDADTCLTEDEMWRRADDLR